MSQTHSDPEIWHEIVEVTELNPLLQPQCQSLAVAILDYLIQQLCSKELPEGVELGLAASGIAGLYPVVGIRILDDDLLLEDRRDKLNELITANASKIFLESNLTDLVQFWSDSRENYESLWSSILKRNCCQE